MDTKVSYDSAVSNAGNPICPPPTTTSTPMGKMNGAPQLETPNHTSGHGVQLAVTPPLAPSFARKAAAIAPGAPVTRPPARSSEMPHTKLQQMVTMEKNKESQSHNHAYDHDGTSSGLPSSDFSCKVEEDLHGRFADCNWKTSTAPAFRLRCSDVEAQPPAGGGGVSVSYPACTTETGGALALGPLGVVNGTGGVRLPGSNYLEPPMGSAWPGSGTAAIPGLAAGGGSAYVEEHWHYSHRSPWLRALVLGANDGLVSIASLMLGVGAVKTDVRAMVISGLAGLVAGAGSMAIGEFVSVFSQRDTELADLEKERQEHAKGPEAQARELEELTQIYVGRGLPYYLAKQVAEELSKVDVLKAHARDELGIDMDALSNPLQAALASALAFSLGGAFPLLAGAFVVSYKIRIAVVVIVSSIALAMFGAAGAQIGGAPLCKAALRVLLGGWLAMSLTYGILRLLGNSGL